MSTRPDAKQQISESWGTYIQNMTKYDKVTVLKGQSGYPRDSSFYSGPSFYLKKYQETNIDYGDSYHTCRQKYTMLLKEKILANIEENGKIHLLSKV